MENATKVKLLINLTDELKSFISKENFFNQSNSKILLESVSTINRNLIDRKYSVAVIAAMKAGKSTLFNAILGEDILPNETAACTVAITEIKHANRNSNKICKYYKDGSFKEITALDGKELQDAFLHDIRETRSKNQVKDIYKYYVEHTFEVLNQELYKGTVENFVLIDTPGPNEASNGDFDTKELKETTYYQLRNADAIIFILDYQVYKSETNATLLKEIFAGREDIKSDNDKIFFVVNKLDARTSKDGSKEDIIEAVKKMIIHQTEGIISNPKVIGISALMALYGRSIKNENVSEANLKDCKEKYERKYSKTVVINGEEYIKTLKPLELADVLINESGISDFEQLAILNTFYKASDKMIIGSKEILSLKLDSIEKDIQSNIDIQSKTVDELNQGIGQSKKEIGQLKDESSILFSEIKRDVIKLNEDIEGNINTISADIKNVIDGVLNNYNDYYESTDKNYLDRISSDMGRICSNAVENFVLRKQDEIIRLYNNYRNQITMDIYKNMNELSRRADTIIRKNLDVEVKTGNMFSLNIEEGIFNSNIETTEKGNQGISDEDFGKQAKRGMTTAAQGAYIGFEVAGPIGALVGGIAGFFLGIGTYQGQAPVIQITKYKLDTTEMKYKLKTYYVQESLKLQGSYEQYIKLEVINISEAIDEVFANFVSQVNEYLNGLLKEYESKRQEREAHIEYLSSLGTEILTFKTKLDNIKV